MGVAADLNRDGTDDYIIRGPRQSCGTGGCPYLVFNGATTTLIGILFGNPVVVRSESMRGFPNLDVYSHGSVDSGSFTSYVFDGAKYVAQSTRHLQGREVETLFQGLSEFPRWPPSSPRF